MDRLCRFKFLEVTETIIWKRSSQTTEAILAIETIFAHGWSEIDSSSISNDPYTQGSFLSQGSPLSSEKSVFI